VGHNSVLLHKHTWHLYNKVYIHTLKFFLRIGKAIPIQAWTGP